MVWTRVLVFYKKQIQQEVEKRQVSWTHYESWERGAEKGG